ncbi:mitochondrial 37S ribosomal protein mS23 RSM25 [Sporobolomyces koalae]|uniref:mitochondrial 37S ribosomal protein mS23 RSM25 n=1 Tax=Sporobolomyces koalae TaxID=500713 RepID=UPI00317A791E
MNSRKSAKAIPSTINRFLKSRALLKSPPPAFYPLAAHPPPPSLVRSFPVRDEHDLAPRSPARASIESRRAKAALNEGLRVQPDQLLHSPWSTATGASTRQTRRKPPKPFNPKHARPEPIVFPEDKIRTKFYRDHPFEAYRPISLVESDRIQSVSGPEGKDWTALSQRTLNPTPEDCIAFILNLNTSHDLSLAAAYPLGTTQYRTLRSEFETSTLSARLQAQSHGAVFFGEIDKSVLVEERVLDEWVRAKEIQDEFAASGGANRGQPAAQPTAATTPIAWAPVESRPAQLGGSNAVQGEAVFTGGVEYLNQFERGSAAANASS